MKVVEDDLQKRHAIVLEMLETVLAMEIVGQAEEVYSLKGLLEQVR